MTADHGRGIRSVGLLLYRRAASGDGLEVLLGHMGGPYWSAKDDHAWSIPKGLEEASDRDLLRVAEREFAEEMGSAPPAGPTLELGTVRSGKKTIIVFARAGDFAAAAAVSNTFPLEWPPHSGRSQEFPEIDKVAWLPVAEARAKLVKGQLPFLDRLQAALAGSQGSLTPEG